MVKTLTLRIRASTLEDLLETLPERPRVGVSVSEFGDRLVLVESSRIVNQFVTFAPEGENLQPFTIHVGPRGIRREVLWGNETRTLDRVVVVEQNRGLTSLDFTTWPLPPGLSRLILAVHPEDLQRLRTLRIMLVGTSRTGTHVAWSLLRLQPEKLILVDPDVWEIHHRDAAFIPLPESFLGRAKAVTLAEILQVIRDQEEISTEITVIPRSIWDVPPPVFADVDVVITAVDNLPARLFVDAVTESFRMLWVDLGLTATREAWGGSVRVIWPENERLRDIMGASLADWRRMLTRERPERERGMGSHPAVSQVNAGLGILALIQAVSGTIRGGELRWDFQQVAMQWEAWDRQENGVPRNRVGRTPSFLGEGIHGILRFRQWAELSLGSVWR